MDNRDYFKTPTEEELRNIRIRMITKSSDEELYKLYYETLDGILNYRHNNDMIKNLFFKEDLDLIKIQLKDRNLVIPFDYTSSNILNVHLSCLGIISLIIMEIIVNIGLLDGFKNYSRLLLLVPFATLVLIGVINLLILSITNEKPIKFIFETLIYDFKKKY
ncbi:hypothetical protein [uncultured Clostridium sp.]|uniref:hypothetical protein n=1 Tax=uncultured Clostridium sp. TaxID=59620 RepID=UPI0028F025DA|nr:hypothetical protein [uncultured Clostridium sp.]